MEQLQTKDREIKGLLKTCAYTGAKRGLILTLDESATWEAQGILIEMIPVWKWMLETND
ncbi:hypothetical protein [Algoriphagus boritolerans]